MPQLSTMLTIPMIRWVEEILHRLGWLKPHKERDINWCRISSIHGIFLLMVVLEQTLPACHISFAAFLLRISSNMNHIHSDFSIWGLRYLEVRNHVCVRSVRVHLYICIYIYIHNYTHVWLSCCILKTFGLYIPVVMMLQDGVSSISQDGEATEDMALDP